MKPTAPLARADGGETRFGAGLLAEGFSTQSARRLMLTVSRANASTTTKLVVGIQRQAMKKGPLILIALISLIIFGFCSQVAASPVPTTPSSSQLPAPTHQSSPLATLPPPKTPTTTPAPVIPSTQTNRDTWIAVAALASSILIPTGIEVIKWISSRGHLNLIIASAQTTLKRWTQSELDYGLRDVPRLIYAFVPDPNRLVGLIRTAFTVLEFSVTHSYRQPLVVQGILIEPNESVSYYKIGSHAPPSASRLKTQDNYWVFDLDTREPASLAEPIILEPGESVGRRIEFLIRSDAPASWQGSHFFTCVPEERIFTTARITVFTNRKTRTFIIPVEVKDYSNISRELYEEHQNRDPKSMVTTWHQGTAPWITDDFPRRIQQEVD
jgi:hypothetical protein